MYYVIQKLHNTPDKHFISYQVPKYILSNKNENIIFEFGQKPNVKRKWTNKNDIILLTQNKEFYLAYLDKLTALEQKYLKEIEKAEKEVEKLVQAFEKSMNNELDSFKELAKKNADVPTLL